MTEGTSVNQFSEVLFSVVQCVGVKAVVIPIRQKQFACLFFISD